LEEKKMADTKINPYLEANLNKKVKVIVTLEGTLTGYFDDAIIIDVESGPTDYMVMTNEKWAKVQVV
jgi:hypothetical protein